MNRPGLRNVAIVVALAALVALLPGGGTGAAVFRALLSVAFGIGVGLLLIRLYRENRIALLSLGDGMRVLLYGALGLGLFCAVAAARLFAEGAAGIAGWFALVAAAVYALVVVWRHHRAYG